MISLTNIHQFKQYLFNNLWWGENYKPSQRTMDLVIEQVLVAPPASGIWGIDISHWNLPPVNLQRMKDVYGLQFVIIKGCDGSLRSRYSVDHVAAAKAAGLPFGFYDWLYPNNRVSIDAQTTAWVNQANEFEPPMGIHIDAEWTTYSGVPANPSASDLRAAHDGVRNKYGKNAVTYTVAGYANQYLQGFDWNREDIWIANYGVTRPMLPSGVTRYLFWQYTSTLDGHALDPNGNAELDGNLFNGTQAEFDQRYGGATEPPPTGETMRIIRGTARGNVTRRDAPAGSAFVPPRYLVTGDQIEASENSVQWLHLTKINGEAVIGTEWASAGTDQRYITWEWVEVTPPVDPPPAPTLPASWDVTQVAKATDGTVLATYTGTLNKQ